ncbi:hypothetical protein QE385_001162 [Sphingomonas sp. SORGH_AS 950]|uniref:hypothetical protein n=1 Tax=unclassified Sphingomonas TaxID=196159 RepID=UPI00277D2B19|nr:MULTISPECIES: hypothetical protein [unclassified Sphingomonas]MDQ1156835.1 hypothetical protein [Sphingomonas sp. SORGH_AS_0950]MDR6115306.1 hypothetical protein [Sphingomonas sp. SORGH_AS_0789]MDR6147229.1 hypothetical protein [Sphingomonas sp. SORGH_AS_0870]MDR6151019.1 hypothetical protein [Sphingomonas sp. SORGH_AS_0742]
MSGSQFMVVMIVAIVMIASIFKSKHRRSPGLDIVEHLRGEGARDTQALRGEIQQLKERIQVLERVITDQHKSIDLDREIERLRDR